MNRKHGVHSGMTGKKVAVIDLGFNSVKLVNYRVEEDGRFKSFEQYSTLAQIGEGVDLTGLLNEQRMKATLDELKSFEALVKVHSVDRVLPVATSAVREAGNREDFLSRVKRNTGFDFRVLTEKEEGVLSFLGASSALKVKNAIFFDLGGGSLELVSSSNGRIVRNLSLPLGSLRLTQSFSRKEIGSIGPGSLERLKAHVESVLADNEVDIDKGALLIGVGGTVRAITRFDQEQAEYPINKLHNYTLTRSGVRRAIGKLSGMTPEKIARIEAFKGERSRTVLAGSCVVDALMDMYGFNRMTVSTHGLRDGILIEWLNGGRSSSARKAYGGNGAPAAPLEYNARRLIESLIRRKKIDRRETGILWPAVGELVRSGDMLRPESLFYAILYEDSFLSHREQLVMALSIIYRKRPRIANWLYSKHEELLTRKDWKSVKKLGSLLELLEAVMLSNGRIKLRASSGSIGLETGGRDRKGRAETLEEPVKKVSSLLGVKMTVSAGRAKRKGS